MLRLTDSESQVKRNSRPKVLQEHIEEELAKIVNLGNFECAYLFSEEGLLIAGVQGRSPLDQNRALEFYYAVHEAFSLMTEDEELGGGREILLLSGTRKRIVIRQFEAFGQRVTLIFVVPRGKTFRAHANRLVRMLQQVSKEVSTGS